MNLFERLCGWWQHVLDRESNRPYISPYAQTSAIDQGEQLKQDAIRRRLATVEKELDRISGIEQEQRR